MNAKWGDGWRAQVGLSPDSFPAHNTGSGASWYLTRRSGDTPTGAIVYAGSPPGGAAAVCTC